MPEEELIATRVPLVVYKDGERVVVGEVILHKTEQGYYATGRFNENAEIPKAFVTQEYEQYSMSVGPYVTGQNSPSDLVLDRRDWETPEVERKADDGDQTS